MSKYILVLKMPTGRCWVLGNREGGIALLPVEDNFLMMKDIFAFDSETKAAKWIEEVGSERSELINFLSQISILDSNEAFT